MEVKYTPPSPRVAGSEHSQLAKVRHSIYTLYRRLSPASIDAFSTGIPPGDVTVLQHEDLHAGTQRVARILVRHLRLPDTRINVVFQPMAQAMAGRVTLSGGPTYVVEINLHFARQREDIGAVLAHEVMHTFLQYHDMRYEDEILTDTAAAYLGAGCVLLNTHRTLGTYSQGLAQVMYSQKVGYLQSEEFGYVLGKRAIAFSEDMRPWLTSPQAQLAYKVGYGMALDEWNRPPLLSADARSRRRYEKTREGARRRLDRGDIRPHAHSRGHGYNFSGRSPLQVGFTCPTCNVNIKVPVTGKLRIRCDVCHTILDCAT